MSTDGDLRIELVKSLAQRMRDRNNAEAIDVASEWIDEIAINHPDEIRFGLSVYHMAEALTEIGKRVIVTNQNFYIHTTGSNTFSDLGRIANQMKEISMDHTVNVNTKGGDITGAAIGSATVNAETIQSMKGQIESSGNINHQGKVLLKNALDEIVAQSHDEQLKTEIIEEFKKLRDQLDQDKPNRSIIRKCWGAIKAVGESLPTIVALDKWLAPLLLSS